MVSCAERRSGHCGAAARRLPVMAAAAPDYSYTAGLVKVLENPRWPIARACQAVEACLDMNKCAAPAVAATASAPEHNCGAMYDADIAVFVLSLVSLRMKTST